jgi:iron complex transport system substrate-binding protein
MNKRWHFPKLFLLMILAFFLVTGCYSQLIKNTNIPRAKLAATECRVFQHQLGETCVPLNPQRVIALDDTTLEVLLALGVKPIGAVQPNITGSKKPYLGKKAEGIASLGKDSQPNLEKMVQLHPDFMIGFEFGQENYELFSRIAPTVSLEYIQIGWKDALQRAGEILGKTEQAQDALVRYQKRVKELRKALENQLGKTKVSVSRFYAGLQFTEFRTQYSFPVSVLQEVGLSLPKVQLQTTTSPDETYVAVSLENLDWLDADVLFVVLNPGSEEIFKKYQTSQLWQLLNVVKNNQVYTVDAAYWIFGNILSANAILDDLFKYLLISSPFK